MGMAGIRADNATPETMTTAFKELGNQFKTLVEKTSIKIDNEFFDTVKDVAKEQARFLGQDTNRAFQAYVDDILKMKNIVNKNPNKTYILSGDDYQNTASRLRRAEREATDPELKRAYQGLIDSFDDMMARSQPKAVQDAWQIARSQYRNLKIIDKAVQGGTNADRVAGNVPLHGLRAAVLGADRAKYSRGGNRLNELSRIGDLLGESIPPNSGTATRGLYTGALTGGPVLAAMFGGADPGSMAAGAGIALGAPRVAQSLYNASGDYLKNQVLPTRPLNRGLFGAIGLERAPSFYEE